LSDNDTTSINTPEQRGTEGVRVTMARSLSVARRRWRTVGYIFGVTCCLLLMALGTVFGHFYWGSKAFRDNFPKLLAGFLTGDPFAHWEVKEQFPDRNSINVLILGVDYDYDNSGRIVKKGARSDSIMIAHVDFMNKTINALTIPRDTAVRIPGRSGIHKINAAHAFGGPDLAIETIRSVFGVEADAYVVVNFDGFKKIVDAVGGIDINVKVPRGRKGLDYDDNWGNLHIHLKPGYQHLNGYQAMGYVRMRHSDSDEMRSRRQHEFLEVMRNKIMQRSTFLKLPEVLDRLNDSFLRGRLTEDQLFALANFARSLPKEKIDVETLPSFEGPSYVTVDAEKSAQVIQRMFYPNQYVALSIDAPDPGSVRSMNAPYERGHRRHSRHPREKTPAFGAKPPAAATEPAPTGGLSVEPPPTSPEETPQTTPPPADPGKGDGGDDNGGKTDGKDSSGSPG
jgi:LCP family protein required for cell wall assembly